jgi:hypothetical protein
VVIWDVATFFAYLRVIEISKPGSARDFYSAPIVAVVPLFALGREILFVPYRWPEGIPPGEPWLAYLDLLFGNALILLWTVLSLMPDSGAAEGNRRENTNERLLVLLVFIGCAYYLVSALENTIQLAWAPFEPALYGTFHRAGIPISVLNCVQFAAAVGIALLLRSKDFLRAGTCFGIGPYDPRKRGTRNTCGRKAYADAKGPR